MKINTQKLDKTLVAHMLSKVFMEITVFMLCTAITWFLGLIICTNLPWHRDNLFYYLLKFVYENAYYVLSSFFILGFCAIVLKNYIKILNYISYITAATKNLYDEDNTLIELPSELNSIENKLNNIKMSFISNKRAAKEAEQRKNDLVVYLAHDLKTPLTSVIGYLTLLHDEDKISDELREKYLAIALNKSERLEDLINEFFDITRFNLSNITLTMSNINLTRMLQQIIFEFKPMLATKNLQCTLDILPDLMLRCDVDKMQRVFDNLLRNAVNYSFSDTTIKIIVEQLDGVVKLYFTNCGGTIPKEKLDRIFEQFYRLDSARTTTNGGVGLGLAIAQKIIALHNGSITASSVLDVITFELTLPTL